MGDRPLAFGEKLFPLCDAFLIWAPFNLNEPAPDRLVCANFLPAILAFCCRFLRILADLTGSVFMKQVLGLATILPFLGPDEHLKPCLGGSSFGPTEYLAHALRNGGMIWMLLDSAFEPF